MTSSSPDHPPLPDRPESFAPPASSAPPRADDLPHRGRGPSGPPPGVFDRTGAGEPGPQVGVPERAVAARATPSVADPARRSSTSPASGQVLGRQVKPWQFIVGLAVVFVPLLAWLAISLGTRSDEPPQVTVASPSPSPSPSLSPTPSFSPTPLAAPSATLSVRPSVVAPSMVVPSAPVPGPTTKPRNPAPPSPVPAPGVKITAIPADAKTIRFEAVASGGLPLEVSFRDRTHDQVTYPAQKTPFAIELPVGTVLKDREEIYSLTARIPYDARPDQGGDVLCRVLVDGVLVSSQQRQGYSSCFISPRYDLGRP